MASSTYQQELGERLRAIRQQQDLTLQDIETRTGGAWKAVVVGSYERGDRAVSIAKLAELARFYGVPLSELLPRPTHAAPPDSEAGLPRTVLDLTRLEHAASGREDLGLINRYTRRIQLERGDYNGRVLTLRQDDVRALSAVCDVEPSALIDQLRDEDVLING
ncbi:MAG: transcriptional regulator [Actinobacteria bacterium]|nr:transcriptional regulator [Actinomycetota bacterium]